MDPVQNLVYYPLATFRRLLCRRRDLRDLLAKPWHLKKQQGQCSGHKGMFPLDRLQCLVDKMQWTWNDDPFICYATRPAKCGSVRKPAARAVNNLLAVNPLTGLRAGYIHASTALLALPTPNLPSRMSRPPSSGSRSEVLAGAILR